MKDSNGPAEEPERSAEAQPTPAPEQQPSDDYVVPVDPQDAVGCDDCQ